MKGSIPRITLIGSNSGRNVGDAAILSSIMDMFTQELPDVEFLVPSSNPSFVEKHYGKEYKVKGVNFMPWTASIRLVGLTTFVSLMKSDVALICDGIIFGKKLFNPFFNWLIQLIFVVPFARLVGCKVVCFSCGIGPFPSPISRKMARFVLNNCDLVILRENDSKKLAEEIGVTKPIHVTGDAAFVNKVSDPARGEEILRAEGVDTSKPLVGVNINSYFGAWLGSDKKMSPEEFIETIAKSVESAIQKTGGAFAPLVFSTQVMDEWVGKALADRLGAKLISNAKYLSHDLQAVMKRCELFIGMRFHSVVLSTAVEVPAVALLYMPKVRGFMRDVSCEDFGVELDSITVDSLSDTIARGWNERAELKARQKRVVDVLKEGARRAATVVCEKFFPNYKSTVLKDGAKQAVSGIAA